MDSATESYEEVGSDLGPRAASTVMLVRDGEDGPEVLLTVRARGMSFMEGAVVFPGGALARADADPRWEEASARGRSDAAAALNEADQTRALAFFIAGLREAFEEVGFVIGDGPLERLPRDRAAPIGFLEHCLRLDIVLATNELAPAGRWVTPPGASARFDTQFFIARVPDGWEPRPNEREIAACLWTTPGKALEELGAGRYVMAPPTISALQRLEGHPDVRSMTESITAGAGVTPGGVMAARLHPFVKVVLAPNPGPMTGPGTNTYVVGAGPTVIIDPAVSNPQYVDEVLEAAGEVAGIVVTHRHADHIGGLAALSRHVAAPVRAYGTERIGEIDVVPVEDGEVIEAGDLHLIALHTPGHASDHLCLMMESSMFSGDTILGEGTAVIAPPDGDMADYMATLLRLQGLDLGRIYPGHWKVVERGKEAIDAYIRHRVDREAAIVGAVAGGRTTVEEIVDHVYTGAPALLRPVAQLTVLAHLQLLDKKGAVACDGAKWRVVGDDPFEAPAAGRRGVAAEPDEENK
jgi:glyoxylase-like metal-dependent hydrolase (beta-lactamase superfamily II)/8-oxo-dGTP pyrophosphatase MutT (NUDIX family)